SLDAKEPVTAEESLDAKEPVTAVETELEPVENFPLEKVFEPLPEIKSEDADKPIQLKEKKPADEFPLQEVFKPLPTVKPEEIDTNPKQPVKPKEVKRTEFFPLQEVFQPLSTLKLDKLEESFKEEKPEDEPKSIDNDTLDDILDKAYNERDKGHVWQAIELYKKALERYRNDEYAPFVVIDLGNLYKEQALYSKAIKIYEEALMLPAVKRSASTKKEFANNLGYLRIVRDVLLKHHMLSTPFDKLPRETLQEVDTEFKKVQINSAQSK
ncbi:MAG: tetratricopeptide repeat protein, partial [Selenomonadaceae bacterium]|nr:tetratricopeptide repeat protein [Selenomonadaceae bacterium]